MDRPFIDISIPLRFGGPQPNAFGVAHGTSAAFEAGEMVGDTRRGGSCNFEQITLIPHCNGTHTECIGHITHERIFVNDCLTDVLITATLVTIEPLGSDESDESYSMTIGSGDRLITRERLEKALVDCLDMPCAETPTALILRTLPNNDAKLGAVYDEDNIPPYFTTEAMEYIVESAFRHLLVDTPSIDRLFDGGRLSNHRIFWNVEPGSFELNEHSKLNNTITEMIYVPPNVADGKYTLNLQIPPFMSDAAPSRPILMPR